MKLIADKVLRFGKTTVQPGEAFDVKKAKIGKALVYLKKAHTPKGDEEAAAVEVAEVIDPKGIEVKVETVAPVKPKISAAPKADEKSDEKSDAKDTEKSDAKKSTKASEKEDEDDTEEKKSLTSGDVTGEKGTYLRRDLTPEK
jgi:hypothetical protein